MAFALRKHDSEFDSAPMSDMNVTPLVDVMLVLLIVFMVAAPLMAAGVPVDLPKAQAKPLIDQKQPIAVSINSDGKYYVDQREVASDDLIMVLGENADSKDRRIHVRGDKTIAYGKVIEIMGLINSAGYTKVALVSESPGASSQPAARAAKP
ncbi:protein TolR [Methylocapsa palsarum]|uniref:Biopolymer transport protein ExbD/biopolymer transport protein TolR n=1 Tax=Methylocapsa palsarum TaxID=1612308 RepID=A0A1I3VXM5_9HYPH|nr:protein TolR [Methylocapsa palsarum]SFK00118.1 biopolymer transport protein ExbD/biopolymer transport protein TolR [Methylocapsa palsarum]